MRKMQCTVVPKSTSNIVQETVKNVHESCEWCTPKRKNSPRCRKNRRAGLCRARPGAYNKNRDGNEDGRAACCLSGRIGAACGALQPPAEKTQGPACRRKQKGKKPAADTARPPPGRGAPTGARGQPKTGEENTMTQQSTPKKQNIPQEEAALRQLYRLLQAAQRI